MNGKIKTPKIEGYEITDRIIREFGEKVFTTNFKVSQTAVSQWIDLDDSRRTSSILTRMRGFLVDLADQGEIGKEMAVRICRFFCSAVGRMPVERPPKAIAITDLLAAVAGDSKESADVQVSFAGTVADHIATSEELAANLAEVDQQIETAARLRRILEAMKKEADENGGRVALNLEEITKRRLV